MANKQTRSLHKLGFSRKVQKGQQDPNNAHSGYAITVPFDLVKGRCVNSSAEREGHRNKPRKGFDNPLKREPIVFEWQYARHARK